MVQAGSINTLRDGDRYEFVFKDGLTGLVTGKGTALLKRMEGDLYEVLGSGAIAHTISSQSGYVFKDGNGTYDPPWNVVPGGELAVGNKSSARSIQTEPNGSQQWLDVDSKIVGREKITTPLGVIDTFKVEVNMVFQRGVRAKLTFWYEPGWGYSVRMMRELRRQNNTPDIFIREVTARSRAG